ncbi:GRP family sugar transporter [Catenulispora pinisilvae]|uniref:GRP family sugar transporter n=1 Tax=Catenulispora pinisilvae TaxID=2705253 RepID=UPI001891FB35|nr:GRP family sugar transporter [Catenulispora pinisilvae]
MTTLLLSLAIVVSWGSWIPVAQAVPGAKQSTRTFYVTAGNLVFATIALIVGGSAGQVSLGWKEFWLPLAGGVVWALGSFCAFRATERIGLARAAGTWTPLNIVVAFVFGALLFSELKGFSAGKYVALGGCLVLVLSGVFLIIGSQGSSESGSSESGPATADGDRRAAPGPTLGPAGGATGGAGGPVTAATATTVAAPADTTTTTSTSASTAAAQSPTHRIGLTYAVAAGLLWGGYFIPAQWAHVPSQLGNFPLAIGMFVAAAALAAREGGLVVLTPRPLGVLLGSGLLFGIGSVALLGLVSRVGTGVGFTIAQLSLLVNAGAGIWVFKVPAPGTKAARTAIAGILLAGVGGTVIGAMR